jgi:CHRD domain
MRFRTLAVLFVVGLVGTGIALAGVNDNWSIHATGASEVPPRDTRAQGQAILHLADDEASIDFRLIATNIDNVVQAHIHVGPPGENGPIVAFLYGLVDPGAGRQTGVLSTGTITAASLTGPLTGHPLADLITEIRNGNAYVNVHTNDGVAPTNTGPGDFPGGEVRGNIEITD